MSTKKDPIQARTYDHIDGVWALCPHCSQDNEVTWSGQKTCTQCEQIFEVVSGPLVSNPATAPSISIFVGPGGQLFYNDGQLSFP
jgi:hypothetical protein